MITYGTAKSILSKYAGLAGKCDGPEVDLFVRKVLQYLLFTGAYGNERKFCFHAYRGCVTLPHELEVPLKVRIDGEVGSVWNRWFEYHSGNSVDDPCLANSAILEEPNRFPTVYDGPSSGFKVGVTGTCNEDEDAHVIIKGEDTSGTEVFTTHKGEKVVGEYLRICKHKTFATTVTFSKITEVYKTRTNGYVELIWLQNEGLRRGFLARYDPYEETPSYRRIKLLVPNCPPIVRVSILGRIKLKDYYADEDLIPFDNVFLLDVAGMSVNNMSNVDVDTALKQDAYVEKLAEKEGEYKKVNVGAPADIFQPLSGGAVRNAAKSRRLVRRRFGAV